MFLLSSLRLASGALLAQEDAQTYSLPYSVRGKLYGEQMNLR